MAGRLHDRLSQAFGRKSVFMDVDNIPPGVDFVNHLSNHMASCEVFLAVVGPNWLNAKNEDGDRRLDSPEDFVAAEIAATLSRDIRVISVLVDCTRMPKVRDLPEVLKPLVRRNAIELRHDQFGRDVGALIERIREALPVKRTMSLRWKYAAGIAAAFLLLGSISLLLERMPLSVWSAVMQALSERPVVDKPSDQPEELRPAHAAEVVKPPDQPVRWRPSRTVQEASDSLSGLRWSRALGFELDNLSNELRSKYKIKDDVRGLVITAVDLKSQVGGLGVREGDVLVVMGNQFVSDISQVGQIFDQLKKNDRRAVLLSVFEGDKGYDTLSMPLD
jgi:hypothetical protein